MSIRSFLSGTILSTSLLAFPASAGAADGAYAWGHNMYGQLGIGFPPFQVSTQTTPREMPAFASGVSVISGADVHALGIQNGALYAWGNNEAGNLGDGTTTVRTFPVAVLGMSSGVTDAGGGSAYSVAVKDGAAYSWGYNVYGQLGQGTIDPVFTVHATPAPVVGLESGVARISSGDQHTLALHNGALVAWGRNHLGQLGDGTQVNSATPTIVPGMESGVTEFAATDYSSFAIKNGALYAWGGNQNAQLGNSIYNFEESPLPVPALDSGVTAVAGGATFSLAIKDGAVYTWGSNQFGQMGMGATDFNFYLTPQAVPLLSGEFVEVAAANGTAYALSVDGSIWTWGRNGFGEMADGTLEHNGTPYQLVAPDGYRYTGITAGRDFAIATVSLVPEPASLAAVGLAGLVLRRRR